MEFSLLLAKVIGVFLLTFVLEDVALLTAAGLVAAAMLPLGWAFSSAFLGVWVGDVGIYLLARSFNTRLLKLPWFRRHLPEAKIRTSQHWFDRHGNATIVAARFIPGARLPTYVAAGFSLVSSWRFALLTGVSGLAWVAVVFAVVRSIDGMAVAHLHMWRSAAATAVLAALGAGLVIALMRRPMIQFFNRLTAWEFWPPWAFYFPVVFIYGWLAWRYRSLTLPSVSNPGIHTGGLIGESKAATLLELAKISPEYSLKTILISEPDAPRRVAALQRHLTEIAFPFVLKPDVAQRGSGFRIAQHFQQAKEYLEAVNGPVVLQEYSPGPHEAGVFYYRLPTDENGRIFAITEKVFPEIVGDGNRTVRQLIEADARASKIARIYLARHLAKRDEVLAPGEHLQLVQAGNHAQGCIFREGSHLWTQALEDRINEIAKRLEGFFIGRLDVRFSDLPSFQRGEDFKILEVNGAASEATNAYDATKPLMEVYGILRRQWELIFAIGNINRHRGFVPVSIGLLWREWRNYQMNSRSFPISD